MKQVFTGEITLDVVKAPDNEFDVLHQVYEEAPKRFETQPHQALVLYRVGGRVLAENVDKLSSAKLIGRVCRAAQKGERVAIEPQMPTSD